MQKVDPVPHSKFTQFKVRILPATTSNFMMSSSRRLGINTGLLERRMHVSHYLPPIDPLKGKSPRISKQQYV
jgi:hypothetical protein